MERVLPGYEPFKVICLDFMGSVTVKTRKMALKDMLIKMPRGEEPTPGHGELCTVLVMAANVASERPVALGSRMRRTLGAPLEPQAVQDKQYLKASRHRQDLVDLWWKPWKEQRFASILAYDNL